MTALYGADKVRPGAKAEKTPSQKRRRTAVVVGLGPLCLTPCPPFIPQKAKFSFPHFCISLSHFNVFERERDEKIVSYKLAFDPVRGSRVWRWQGLHKEAGPRALSPAALLPFFQDPAALSPYTISTGQGLIARKSKTSKFKKQVNNRTAYVKMAKQSALLQLAPRVLLSLASHSGGPRSAEAAAPTSTSPSSCACPFLF